MADLRKIINDIQAAREEYDSHPSVVLLLNRAEESITTAVHMNFVRERNNIIQELGIPNEREIPDRRNQMRRRGDVPEDVKIG